MGAGYLRTAEGHYDHAFAISATLCLAAAAGVLFIGRQRASGTPEVDSHPTALAAEAMG